MWIEIFNKGRLKFGREKSYYSFEPEYKVPLQEDCYKKRIENLIRVVILITDMLLFCNYAQNDEIIVAWRSVMEAEG